MATNFPSSLDSLTNPNSTDTLNSQQHSVQHQNANDAIEVLEAKVGADSSAVTTSHDYKLGEVTGSDKAVGKTATQTLTNKSLTAPVITGAATTQTVLPASGYTYDLGSAGVPYNNLYSGFSVNIQASGINTGIRAGANGSNQTLTLPLGTDTIVARATTDTLTNKRITKRENIAVSLVSPTSLLIDEYDISGLTAQNTALTFDAPTGTPTEGQTHILRIKDNGTARALTWNAIFRAMGVALPTTTVISKTLYLFFIYNASDTKWDLVSVSQEA